MSLGATVQEVRLELLTMPNLLRKTPPAGDVARQVSELAERGYASAGQVFTPDALRAIRARIDALVDAKEAEWNPTSEYWEVTEPLGLPGMLDLATSDRILAAVNAYLGRDCYLADSDLRRIPPRAMSDIEKKGKTSSNWHRDTRGRQVKLMVYLTDVGPNDSNFAFYPGSHTKRAYGFAGSRFNDDEARAFGAAPFEWHGKAGEGMLFNTNLVHRLRRKDTGTVRDSVTFYYTPGQFLRRLSTGGVSLSGGQQRLVHGAPWWSKRL